MCAEDILTNCTRKTSIKHQKRRLLASVALLTVPATSSSLHAIMIEKLDYDDLNIGVHSNGVCHPNGSPLADDSVILNEFVR